MQKIEMFKTNLKVIFIMSDLGERLRESFGTGGHLVEVTLRHGSIVFPDMNEWKPSFPEHSSIDTISGPDKPTDLQGDSIIGHIYSLEPTQLVLSPYAKSSEDSAFIGEKYFAIKYGAIHTVQGLTRTLKMVRNSVPVSSDGSTVVHC